MISMKHLNMHAHITSVFKSCMVHLLNISRIRQYIDQLSCETLIHALISSRIDYSNSLLMDYRKHEPIDSKRSRISPQESLQNGVNSIISPLSWRHYIGFALKNVSCINSLLLHSKRSMEWPLTTSPNSLESTNQHGLYAQKIDRHF